MITAAVPVQHVHSSGGRGKSLAAGSHHIGRADISVADRAHIGVAAKLVSSHPERKSSREIADQKGTGRKASGPIGELLRRSATLGAYFPPPYTMLINRSSADEGAHHAA